MGEEQHIEVRAATIAPAVAAPPELPRDGSFRIGQRNRSGSSSGSSSNDRRSGLHHHRSFVFPAHDIVPTSALIQQPGQFANHRRTFQAPFYGTAKVQPARPADADVGDDGAARTAKRAAMHVFPLRFKDANLDEAFCKHYNLYVLKKVRVANQIVVALNAALLLGQYATRAQSVRDSTFASRVLLVALTWWFYGASFFPWFQLYFDGVVFAHYFLHGVVLLLPRLFHLVGFWAARDDAALAESALFCSQKSVRMMSLLHFLILFNASGMRFTTATLCALCHVATKVLFVIALCRDCTFQDLESNVSLAMVGFCMLSSYYGERHVRAEFVERLSVAEERKRRDDLLETMLPVNIKESLKQKRTDDLAEYYDEVSILFCYVSNFQVLSKHASAIDLVKLVNRIVFCFDKATDARGVYKVEAIAETYMCTAGVPYRDPYHCEKVADMALTMMRICETECWSFNGVEIQLQIGIHSGPVAAGVVGSKTYSYHLFGDTVNTSSRVCSSCLPGKIQISERTRQLLARSGYYMIADRGMLNLKGKGMVKLYWLEGKYARPTRNETPDISSSFEAAVEESIRSDVGDYAPHHRSDDYIGYMSAIEISRGTLRFQPKARRRIGKRDVAPSSSDTKDISGTAAEMETVFRKDLDRDSTPQFLTSVRMVALVLLVTLASQVYNQKAASHNGNLRYVINTVALAAVSALALFVRKYPHFYRVKEVCGTVGGMLFVLVINLQIILPGDTVAPENTSSSSNSAGDAGSGDSKPVHLNYLDFNILHAVIFGLAIRLRFVNSVAVNLWTFAVYLTLTVVVKAETWMQITESFLLFLAAFCIAEHFGYKREFGGRCDFLLKCTLRLEKQKCEDLLANMLPSPQYAEALMSQSTVVDELAEVTLLYSDMVGFTTLGSSLKPGDICVLLNKIYSAFDKHLDQFGIYKMDTVGDAFIVVGGLPTHKSERNHAAAIAAFAIEMLHEIDRFCLETKASLQMRIGIHTGKVVGGIVGIKKPRYLIWGHHTVIANLMESRGTPGRIQISEDTFQQLRSCPEFILEERAGRVQISENEVMRTFFIAKNHHSVKDRVINQYLHSRPALNLTALAQLRNCLQLPENSPLSKQLEAARPPLNKSRSFVDIIGKRY
ncbi:hypothetical protein PybrP1_001809 [[Pythium] brassicae (nom. inval.)]|nr:hypothetical protein PybrP1_001809 [[Pythium] brassicae (nom. inval.)]